MVQENLIGKLGKAYVGDVLLMVSHDPELSVAGFLTQKDQKTVKLSFVDPNSLLKWESVFLNDYAKDGEFGAADRTYCLRRFASSRRLLPQKPFSYMKNSNSLTGVESLTKAVESYRIGDVICLLSGKVNVAGYVIEKDSSKVTLSHLDPNAEIKGKSLWWNGYSRDGFWGAGERTFNLNHFTSVDVLYRPGSIEPLDENNDSLEEDKEKRGESQERTREVLEDGVVQIIPI